MPEAFSDIGGIQCHLPPVGPSLAALAAGVQAHHGQVQALEGRLLGQEVAAGFTAAQPAGGPALADLDLDRGDEYHRVQRAGLPAWMCLLAA